MARLKKQQVQSDDGWTIVASSSLEKDNRNGAKSNPAAASQLQNHARGPQQQRIVPGLTVEKLLDEFADMQKRWAKTSCARNLGRMLGLRDGMTVREGVCIGVGSLSVDWEHRWRSLWQLVLFMGVVKMLPQGEGMNLYAQDPAFTPLDMAFLSALNISVLASSIESHITPSSFVFAPFVDWFLLLPLFLQNKDPELYIGNEVLENYRPFANTDEKRVVLAECNRLGKVFLNGREKRKVPEFELHGAALEGLVVYWKEIDSDDE